ADQSNLCLTDNEKMARYLVEEFVANFGAWKGTLGLRGLTYRPLDSVEAGGDPATSYSETVRSGDLTVRLDWKGLGKPFCFALPPDKSATGRHHMPSLFVGCQDATVTVNGRALPGKPVPRESAGNRISTAMLAFSETWIRVKRLLRRFARELLLALGLVLGEHLPWRRPAIPKSVFHGWSAVGGADHGWQDVGLEGGPRTLSQAVFGSVGSQGATPDVSALRVGAD